MPVEVLTMIPSDARVMKSSICFLVANGSGVIMAGSEHVIDAGALLVRDRLFRRGGWSDIVGSFCCSSDNGRLRANDIALAAGAVPPDSFCINAGGISKAVFEKETKQLFAKSIKPRAS
jgi:hypothetical protein